MINYLSLELFALHRIDVYGFIAAFLTSIAFLPQLKRTWDTKSADDISLTTLITFLIGVLFWIMYALKTHSTPVLIANLLTFSLNISILVLKLIFKYQISFK